MTFIASRWLMARESAGELASNKRVACSILWTGGELLADIPLSMAFSSGEEYVVLWWSVNQPGAKLRHKGNK